MSSISLKQFRFTVGHSPFAHNYLVLHDDDGNVVSEMHGLPYDPVKKEHVTVGRSSDYLRAVEFPFGRYPEGKKWSTDRDSQHILWRGSNEEAMAKWQAAKTAHDEINRGNLTYNLWGSDLNGPRDWDAPVPDVIAGNSNSVNRTLVEAMGLKMPSLPTMAPGIETPLLREGLLGQPQPNAGLLAPRKWGLLGPI
jgi:hypothetical protein